MKPLTPDELRERAAKCRMVAADAITDARALDGRPFTGQVVAQEFGQHLAMIHRLAETCAELCELLEKASREPMPPAPLPGMVPAPSVS